MPGRTRAVVELRAWGTRVSEPSETPVIPGQLDVEEVFKLARLEEQAPPAPATAATGELVPTLEPLVTAWVATLSDAPQTQRTYRQASARFLAWLGPKAGPDALTLHTMAAYQAHLAKPGPDATRRSSATIRKERAALNSLLRWAIEHDLIDRQQGALATSVRLPKAQTAGDEAPKALDDAQYQRLIDVVTAQSARDRLIGARDLAMVRTLGDAGLRCEELAALERRDFLPARQGAALRVLNVRFGKGDRQRKVKLTPTATTAIVAWERERTRTLGPAAERDPLFITLGRRRRDGFYTSPGRPVGAELLADVLKRYGQRADLPADLRHPHVLRHTMATRWRRRGRDLETLRKQLGHASMKTTQVYLAADPTHEDAEVLAFDRPALTLEDDAA